MDGRRERGGILRLLELIEEHRGALEFAWRARFGLPLTAVGKIDKVAIRALLNQDRG